MGPQGETIMGSAKRWFLIAAIAAVPFAGGGCTIPLGNGCHLDVLTGASSPTYFQTFVVC
jgi:hypothetical protein